MTLEEMTVENLSEQVKKDEETLLELKKQILAKKIIVKTMQKQAKDNKLQLPNKSWNKFKSKITKAFVDIHNKAELALEKPDMYALTKLLSKTEKILLNASAIPDRNHKNADKLC